MIYTTGNDRVDSIGRIDFSGNMTPPMWYHTIRGEKKPEFEAIAILSDIVYWYRPQEIRDEGSGQVVAFKKKFKGDLLQRSYQQIADQFGITKRKATEAVDFLQKIGAIRKEFRTINAGGIVLNNVLFIDINPERVDELTHPRSELQTEGAPTENVTPITEKCERVSQKNVRGITAECDTLPQKSVTGVTEGGERVSRKNGTGVTEKRETNTKTSPETTQEITTENPTEITTGGVISVRQSSAEGYNAHAPEERTDGLTELQKKAIEREACEKYIKKNLSYDVYLERYKYDDKKMYQQTIDLIIDTICDDCDYVEIGQSRVPHDVVKSRFMKLTEFDVESVLEKVSKQTGSTIKNMHKYMLTALYRETLTSQVAVCQLVSSTMYGEEDNNEADNKSDRSVNDDQYMDFIKRLGQSD